MIVTCKTCGKRFSVSKMDKEECKTYCSPNCFNLDPENKDMKAIWFDNEQDSE